MWRLFCHCLFFLSISFGTSGSLFFLIVAFPGYLQVYVFITRNDITKQYSNESSANDKIYFKQFFFSHLIKRYTYSYNALHSIRQIVFFSLGYIACITKTRLFKYTKN